MHDTTANRPSSTSRRPAFVDRRPHAILFDMDGTLTRENIDYDAVRSDLNITGPILEAIARMPVDRQQWANDVLHAHELRAATSAELNDDCHALLEFIHASRIPTALITRNRLENVGITLDRHRVRFDLVIAREFTPTKPHPAPVIYACRQLNVDVADTWMIGDSTHDIESANAAGAKSVHITHGEPRDFEAEPWLTVESLGELLSLLKSLCR
jgi:HAD superfamily hydrolase (TIGR01549 family)